MLRLFRNDVARVPKIYRTLLLSVVFVFAYGSGYGCGRVGFDNDVDAGPGSDAGSVDAGAVDAQDDAADAGPRFDLTTPFTVVGVLSELGLEGGQSPTTTPDQLQLYFDRGGDIYRSVRSREDDPWGAPVAVSELNGVDTDQSPALSPNGLDLYFSSLRSPPPELDVFLAGRANLLDRWSVPILDVALSAPSQNMEPVGLTEDGLEAYLRNSGNLLVATRRRADVPFPEPVVLSALRPPGDSIGDAWIHPSGLLLALTVGSTLAERRLVFVERPFREDPFVDLRTPLPGLSDDEPAEDPWLSPDLQTLYFVRGGQIYLAQR